MFTSSYLLLSQNNHRLGVKQKKHFFFSPHRYGRLGNPRSRWQLIWHVWWDPSCLQLSSPCVQTMGREIISPHALYKGTNPVHNGCTLVTWSPPRKGLYLLISGIGFLIYELEGTNIHATTFTLYLFEEFWVRETVFIMIWTPFFFLEGT